MSLSRGLAIPLMILGLRPVESLEAQSPLHTLKKIAALGEPYPQGNGEAFADNFQANALNNRGEAAFGSATSKGEGVFFVEATGQMRLVARSGDPAPGGRHVFGSFYLGPVSLNDQGELALAFSLDLDPAPAPISCGLFRFSSQDGLTRVLVPGDPVVVSESPDRIVGTFRGAFFHPSINNLGEVAFPAFVEAGFASDVLPPIGPGTSGIGAVLLRADREDKISTVLKPGDGAPGGKTFDYFGNPWINDRGDIAFGAHLKEDECIPISDITLCAESVYLRTADGEIIPIARQGDPAPGGGTFRLAFGPVVNESRDVAFIGDLTPPPDKLVDLGVFLYSNGEVIPIARPGDPMPGGGKLVRAGVTVTSAFVNEQGDVTFAGVLDSEQDLLGSGTPKPDMGIFTWRKRDGSLHVVARSGTAAPEGILAGFLPANLFAAFPNDFPWILAGAVTNDLGQVFFSATLADGNTHIAYVATPEPVVFRRGDVDLNNALEITDPINLLGHLFLGDPVDLGCRDAADADDSGVLDLTDAVFSLVHQFAGGEPLPPPFSGCGPDPTLDQDALGNPADLGCESYVCP